MAFCGTFTPHGLMKACSVEMLAVETQSVSLRAPCGDRNSMRIGIVRTVGSPCRCAESVICGLRLLVTEVILADSAEIEAQALALAESSHLLPDS